MEHTTNSIRLAGTLASLPEFSHENHGKRFLRFFLEVPRLSGTVDTLPVIVQEETLAELDPSGGGNLRLEGQVRSHNLRMDGVRHLMVYVFAVEVAAADCEPVNEVTLEGALCRDPVYRRTPLGREICDIMLAVPRAFRRADYLPCILWGRTAQEAAFCRTRDRLLIQGRMQSRAYTKYIDGVPQERTAYEISALSAEKLEGDIQEQA